MEAASFTNQFVANRHSGTGSIMIHFVVFFVLYAALKLYCSRVINKKTGTGTIYEKLGYIMTC